MRSTFRRSMRPVQQAVFRGMAVIFPPLLTVVLLIWGWNLIDAYLIRPAESMINGLIVARIESTLTVEAANAEVRAGSASIEPAAVSHPPILVRGDGGRYTLVGGMWMPLEVFDTVQQRPGKGTLATAKDYFRRYVQLTYLRRQVVLPAFLVLFLGLLYLAGKLLAGGIGRLIWSVVERAITRIPLVSQVYSSVKQVSDFAFSETGFQFRRVVAVEYPRPGLWSIGFVTGDAANELAEAIGEPMVNVFVPTSPMPASGYTVVVPRKQARELKMTIDQAIQHVVSCGVVTSNEALELSTRSPA